MQWRLGPSLLLVRLASFRISLDLTMIKYTARAKASAYIAMFDLMFLARLWLLSYWQTEACL